MSSATVVVGPAGGHDEGPTTLVDDTPGPQHAEMFELRVGDETISVRYAAPDGGGSARASMPRGTVLTGGILATDVDLRLDETGAVLSGVLHGRLSEPGIDGTVRISLDPDGRPAGAATWQVVAGSPIAVAMVQWRHAAWSATVGLPRPVLLDAAEGLRVSLPDPAGGVYEIVPLTAPPLNGPTGVVEESASILFATPEAGPAGQDVSAALRSLLGSSGLAEGLATLASASGDALAEILPMLEEIAGRDGPTTRRGGGGAADTPETGGSAAPVADATGEAGAGEDAAVTAGEPGGAPPTGEEEAPEVASEGAAAAEVDLLIPAAPTEPSSANQARIKSVGGRVATASTATLDLPSADATTEEARGAVTEPVEEVAARAEADLAAALGERPAPSPEIVELADRIRTSIREKRPADEDDLLDTDPGEVAAAAGQELNTSVEGDANRVSGDYDALNETPDAGPGAEGVAVAPPLESVDVGSISAASAKPDEIPAEDLTLVNDQARVAEDVAASGIETPTTAEIPTEPFSTVREGQSELGEMEATRTAEVAAAQVAAIDSSRMDMAELQAQAVAALATARSGTVGTLGDGQTAMVGSEELTREQVSAQASTIFSGAQTQVSALLTPLSPNAMARWDAGVAQLSTTFRTALDKVKAWIDDRHSGIGGSLLSIGDAVFGLPGWVTDEYDTAERDFGDGVYDLLLEISTEVNGVIAAAEAIIATARDQISTLFESLPEDLQEWAQGELASFDEQLDGLASEVKRAQSDINSGVSERAVEAVVEVRREVEQLRVEAGGLVGKIAAAIGEFLSDPVRFIINGLLKMVGIPPASFWALIAKIQHVVEAIADDPMRFLDLLLQGLGQGFEQFLSNFPEHLINGFFDWLFRGLGDVGVTVPADFSLPSLITLALEIMGITWANFRKVLEEHLGPDAVDMLESIWSIVDAFMQNGMQGIYELFLPQFNPQEMVDTILDAAIAYVAEVLVVQVGKWIVSLLSPAGWIAKAVEIIYKVAKWVFENAAPMFEFVETVINGVATLLTGDVSGMARAVELGLAATIPITIDFFAGLVGLGDLPDKVVEVIGGLQAMVYDVMDKVIGWLVEQGRALLAKAGFGGQEEEPDDEDAAAGGDEELGEEVKFAGGGEAHRLWFDTSAGGATLMVASTPQPVEARLQVLADEVQRKFADDDEKRYIGVSLVDEATHLAKAADVSADELAAAFEEASRDDAEQAPDDSAVENAERTLAAVLRELFDLLEIDAVAVDLELLKNEIAAALPTRVEGLAASATSWWKQSVHTVTFGMDAADKPQKLWDPAGGLRASPLGTMSTAEAVAMARDKTLYDAYLFDYFKAEDGSRNAKSADTAVFGQHVFTSKGNAGKTRPAVLTELIKAAAEALKADYAKAIADIDKNDPFKARAKQQITKFDKTPPDLDGYYGRLALPVDRIPDHSWFAPKEKPISNPDVQEVGDKRVTTYTTKAGQDFVIDEEVKDDGKKQITSSGTSLSFHNLGRGVTRDSPGHIRDRNLDRAHIIANEVGGSGYSEARNLVTTSAYYNRIKMRDSERALKTHVEAAVEAESGEASPIDTMKFDLDVTVELAKIDPNDITQSILSRPDYKDHLVEHASKISRLTSAEVADAGLMRVLDVLYTMTISGLGAKTWKPGPEIDYWIVIDV